MHSAGNYTISYVMQYCTNLGKGISWMFCLKKLLFLKLIHYIIFEYDSTIVN